MTWIIDILLVVIIAAAGYIGYRRGVVKMLLSFLTVIIALALAFMISGPVANLSYTIFFEETVSNTVDAALENSTVGSAAQSIEELFSSGSVIGGLGKLLGFDTDQVVSQTTGNTMEEIARTLKEDVIRPPMELLLQVLLFVLLFILLWLMLSLIAKGLNRTAKLPVIKGVNALLGGGVGVIIGCLLALAVCAIINLAMKINPQGLFGITEITRDSSVVYQFISDTFLTLTQQ